MTETQTIIGKEFPKKVIPLIEAAKKQISIVVFDWRWYSDQPGNPVQLFNQALVRARRRGVEVRALVNSVAICNILKDEGCKAKKLLSENLLHAKMILIDDDIAIVGSHNYSQSAFTTNFEVSVLIRDAERSKEFLNFFNQLFN
jgi:phosphatidylserine/phosphatidylglycerophosphate/cardiolipin synthase-like enzyme